jgi:hypothetical protein
MTTQEITKLDVKQAVQAALRFARDLYGEAERVRLEEVELSSDERYWLITLGFGWKVSPMLLAQQSAQPDYKVFKVNAYDGTVVSMKIRSLA